MQAWLLLWPLAARDARSAAVLDQSETDDPSPADKSNKNKIVVGVDDTPDNLALLNRIVAKAGYTFFGNCSPPPIG
jgi:hypothetical protein